jgi:hypothetical protein
MRGVHIRYFAGSRGQLQVQTCCRLGFYFVEIILEVRGISPDACTLADVRKAGISKNRSSESWEFFRFSSVSTKTAVMICNVRLRIKERFLLFELSLTFPVLYCILPRSIDLTLSFDAYWYPNFIFQFPVSKNLNAIPFHSSQSILH